MKKVILILLFLISINVDAKNISLSRCIDGDTAVFFIDGVQETVRFLAIDTPESTNKKEFYGKQASDYTCNMLTNASSINLELDSNSDKYDKYDRLLAWVFVDGNLLQNDIVKNGYGEVKYIYGEYKYLDVLYESENYAKANKLGMWQDLEFGYEYYIILGLVILGSIVLTNKQQKQIKKVLKFLEKKLR